MGLPSHNIKYHQVISSNPSIPLSILFSFSPVSRASRLGLGPALSIRNRASASHEGAASGLKPSPLSHAYPAPENAPRYHFGPLSRALASVPAVLQHALYRSPTRTYRAIQYRSMTSLWSLCLCIPRTADGWHHHRPISCPDPVLRCGIKFCGPRHALYTVT